MPNMPAHLVTRALAAAGFFGLALTAGCAHLGDLRTRASFDLQCPEDQVDILAIDGRARGVRACGRQATYIRSCSQNDGCTWILNGETKDLRPALRATNKLGLAIYIDPAPTVEVVKDKDGLHVFELFRIELMAELRKSGFKVAETASEPHELTMHMSAARVGQDDRPWAESVAFDVTGNGKQVTRITRATLNWMTKEGSDTTERVKRAAARTVNDLLGDPAIEIFAESLHGSSAAPAPAAPPASAAPAAGAPPPASPPAP